MTDQRIHGLYRDLVSKRIDRRGFLQGAAAMGISASAAGLFLRAADVRAQAAPAPPVVAVPATDGGMFKGVELTIQVIDASVKQPCDEVRAEFEAATGAKVTIVADPIDGALSKLIEDQQTSKKIDGSMIGMWWLGELVAGNYLKPYDDYLADTSGKFPKFDFAADLPGIQALHMYGGKKYVVPYDADGQVLYYRRDLIQDPTHMKAFKDATGKDLAVPTTMDELLAVAGYFNGKDLGSGKPGSGVSMHLKTGGQGMFHFMTLSAPYVIGPENKNTYWFNSDTMEPLIKSEGHRRAMETYLALAKLGPEAMLGWALGEAWDYFLNGNAMFTYSWGDVAALAVQNKSFVKGKVGSIQMPGTLAYVNPQTGTEYKTDKPNYVGNTTGGSWAGVVTAGSAHPEAAYYWWALMATEPKMRFYAARGSDGVDPGKTFQILPPEGSGKLEDYTNQGWDPKDAEEYTKAYFNTFQNPNQLPYLRIPGTFEYWTALDVRLAEAVSGGQTPDAALTAMAKDFADITDRLGKDTQLEQYKASLGV